MMLRHLKWIPKSKLWLSWLLWFIGIHFVLAGCSTGYRESVDKSKKVLSKTTTKLTRTIRFSDDDLQRMTAVIGFENKSLYRSQDFAGVFRQGISEYLNKECDDVTDTYQNAAEGPISLRELPRLPSGRVDTHALATIGRQLGLNAVITGSLDDISMLDEKRGMVWKDTHHLVQIVAGVEVYDVETGTKILDQSFSHKVEIERAGYELMPSEGKMTLPDLTEPFGDLIREIGETICWAVEDHPWNGFIIAVDGDQVVLSAGSRAGLKAGDEFEVFDTSRIIEARNGQRFFYHGEKIGEIRIVEVEPHEARAGIIINRGIKTGDAVRVR
jgi:hypothetical protein